jgi:hypothetical protein
MISTSDFTIWDIVTDVVSLCVAFTGLYFFSKRLENQKQQIDLQINQRVDERFSTALNLLGNNETSARTGAIYVLHELAIKKDAYRTQVVQILCSHIRSKTNEESYKKTHAEHPSNEIQTCINLLFKPENKGLYTQVFAKEEGFPTPDLSLAYLVGASFREAQCQGASFREAQCQGADFWRAQCQGASFEEAQCQGAYAFDTNQSLEDRIGKNTELKTLRSEGEIDEMAVKAIEDAKQYLSGSWYEKMQTIIKDNINKSNKCYTPEGMITGTLEDSNELQAIINKDWDKLQKIKAQKH